MNTPKPLFPKLDRPARVIVLMSGSGSNAEVLIRASRMENSSFTICALVTDRPERCSTGIWYRCVAYSKQAGCASAG